jgi:hypothetical protein
MSLSSARTTLTSKISDLATKKASVSSGLKTTLQYKNSLLTNASSFTASDYTAYQTAKESYKSNLASAANLLRDQETQLTAVYDVLNTVVYSTILLHFDGTHGAKTLTDSGTYGGTTTSNWIQSLHGGSIITTTDKKFGSSSLATNITARVYVTNSSYPTIGTGDFTLECWHYPTQIGHGDGTSTVLCLGSNTSGVTIRINTANMIVSCNNTTQTYSKAFSTNSWYHLALVRTGGVATAYVNGTSVGSFSSSENISAQTTLVVGGAQWSDNSHALGYIDEVRLLVGSAAYSSNFTVPTSAFSQ